MDLDNALGIMDVTGHSRNTMDLNVLGIMDVTGHSEGTMDLDNVYMYYGYNSLQ